MRLHLVPLAPLMVLAACVPAPREAPPAPAPPPVAAPLPPAPLAADWRDWPKTPGDWRYRQTSTGSIATFGTSATVPIVSLRCEPATRRIALVVPGAITPTVTVRTSTMLRSLPMQGGQSVLVATDPLLDAMGFSRGRFVIEQAGAPPLVLPAWAEIERVTEDCRG
jgi:hypothetical protein